MKKSLKMWRMLMVSFVFMLELALVNTPTADAKSVAMINSTGADIVVLNCSPASSHDWQEDVLGNEIWENGETIWLDFDRWSLAEKWDFKVHYSDGYSDEWYGVEVKHTNKIILHIDGTMEYI